MRYFQSITQQENLDENLKNVTCWVIENVSQWGDDIESYIKTFLKRLPNCIDVIVALPTEQSDLERKILFSLKLHNLNTKDKPINIISIPITVDDLAQNDISVPVKERADTLYMHVDSQGNRDSTPDLNYKDEHQSVDYLMQPVFKIKEPNDENQTYLKKLMHMCVLDLYSSNLTEDSMVPFETDYPTPSQQSKILGESISISIY